MDLDTELKCIFAGVEVSIFFGVFRLSYVLLESPQLCFWKFGILYRLKLQFFAAKLSISLFL